jgi:hypothetical protein
LHAESIQIVEARGHLGSKVLQTADHESEVTFGFSRFASCLMPLLQLGQALF